MADKVAILGLLALVSWHRLHREKDDEAAQMALIRFRAKLFSNFNGLSNGIIRIRLYFFGWRVIKPARLERS